MTTTPERTLDEALAMIPSNQRKARKVFRRIYDLGGSVTWEELKQHEAVRDLGKTCQYLVSIGLLEGDKNVRFAHLTLKWTLAMMSLTRFL